jgi:hypothetical protein
LFRLWTTKLVIAGGELDFQLVVHIPSARDPIRDFIDDTFLIGAADWPAQCDMAINGDDLHVLGVHGHVFRRDDFFANLRRCVDVGLAGALIERR